MSGPNIPWPSSDCEKAIDQARENGMLGKNILDTGFDFDLRIKAGAGAFVCGEETALIAFIEGEAGMPAQTALSRLKRATRNKPTNINNVETLANVPWHLPRRPRSLAALGTKESKGTKVFALCPARSENRSGGGPMGSTLLRFIVLTSVAVLKWTEPLKPFKWAALHGGCIPASHLDTRSITLIH